GYYCQVYDSSTDVLF
nr:immunoglobulin light chain junction region [Macaca mulatta]